MVRQTARTAIYLAGIAAACLAPAQTPEPTPPASPLSNQIATLLADPSVSRAHWGVKVTTLDGAPLYALNEAQFFMPASNTKLFTTSAAMAILKPDATFQTKVVGVLDPSSGAVTGNLTLVGGGEANLSGRPLPYITPHITPGTQPKDAPQQQPPPDPLRNLAELADQLVSAGVKSITGDVVGDDTLFAWEPYPSDWSIDDMVWGYGAPVSALTINDNQIKLTVAPAPAPYKPATLTIFPAMPYYTVEFSVTTTAAKAGSHVQMERAPGSKTLRIYGSIAADANPDVEEVAIQDPAEYSAMALKQLLESRGVTVRGTARPEHWLSPDPRGFLEQTREPLDTGLLGGQAGYACSIPNGPVPPAGTVLAMHRSVPLGEDVMVTNKVSQNLHAELLLHQLARRTCYPTTAQGARVVRSFLTTKVGIDKDDFVFYDGSGLSGHDLVTPRATAKLLQYATTQSWFADWKATLPLGGEDSGLATRFAKPPLKDHVFAKTGTLGEARALSGYLDCASGRTVIFSIMVSTHTPGSSADRDAMDKIVAAIAAAE